MQIHPLHEEVVDLRHKLHIMNAEKFIETKNEHTTLVLQIQTLIQNGNRLVPIEKYEKFQALCRKGQYYSIRGHQCFVRYTMNLKEVNGSLRNLYNHLFSTGN